MDKVKKRIASQIKTHNEIDLSSNLVTRDAILESSRDVSVFSQYFKLHYNVHKESNTKIKSTSYPKNDGTFLLMIILKIFKRFVEYLFSNHNQL